MSFQDFVFSNEMMKQPSLTSIVLHGTKLLLSLNMLYSAAASLDM